METLPNEGDLFCNVLMKSVIKPFTSPSFSAGNDPMWWSPQGPVRPNQIPPSPLKPEIQEQMLSEAAKQNTAPPPPTPTPEPEPVQAMAPVKSKVATPMKKAAITPAATPT